MNDGLFIGLGIAAAGAALAIGLSRGLTAIATALGYSKPDSTPATSTAVLEHVGDIDTSSFTPAEIDEVQWIEETLSKESAPQAELLEAHRLLEQYKTLARDRAAS